MMSKHAIVSAAVRRHMKWTSPGAFTVFDGAIEPPVKVELGPDELLIGWYRNPAPWRQSITVFTSAAFYVAESGVVNRIPIDTLVGCEFPNSKTDSSGVRVIKEDGFQFVRIAGSFGPNGNRKDLFSFIDLVRALARR